MREFQPTDTAADPALIEAAANLFWATAGRIIGRSGDLRATLDSSALNFTSLVASEITSQTGYNVEDWKTAVEAVYFGAGVTLAWAKAVRDFKARRQQLIDEWNTAKGNNFGVVGSELTLYEQTLPKDSQQAVKGAGGPTFNREDLEVAAEEKLGYLNQQIDSAWSTLQQTAADLGNRLTAGPTPENVRYLVEAGALSWAPFNIRGAEAPLPLNPELAAADAEKFKAYTTGKLPPDTEYAAMIAALNAAVQAGTFRTAQGGQLDPRTIQYLQSFYGALGPDLFKTLPGFLNGKGDKSLGDDPLLQRDTINALGGGLLLLSDEKVGGGYDKLPPVIHELFKGVPVGEGDGRTIQYAWSQNYKALSQLLGGDHQYAGGKEFSTQLVSATSYYLDHSLNNPHPDMRQGWDDKPAITMLNVATRNIEANHALLTGDHDPGELGLPTPDLLKSLYSHDWSDGGKAVTGLTDWIYEESTNDRDDTDDVRRQLAGEAAAALIETVTDADNGLYPALADIGSDMHSVGMVNPEVAKEFAKIAIHHLDSFAADVVPNPQGADAAFISADKGKMTDPTVTAYAGGNLKVGEGDAARFFELIAGDEKAAWHLGTGVEAYEYANLQRYVTEQITTGQNKASTYGGANGKLRALYDAGMLNEAMDRTGNEQQARTDAEFRSTNAKTLWSGLAKETVGNLFKWSGYAKSIIGSSTEIYRADVRAGVTSPTVEVQLPNGSDKYTQTALEAEATLSMLESAVRNGKVPLEVVPVDLRTDKPADPIKRLNQVTIGQREMQDLIRPLLDSAVPPNRDPIGEMSKTYAQYYNTFAANSLDKYNRDIRNGVEMTSYHG
ncbi:hypothetical protein [Actinomadura rugatobispora]|uniref:TPR repeat domain-containing protein n=1 Tax=Actinomadura rugatobispora TaxID=1994 RepID=A0ABW1AEG0_9ACTN